MADAIFEKTGHENVYTCGNITFDATTHTAVAKSLMDISAQQLGKVEYQQERDFTIAVTEVSGKEVLIDVASGGEKLYRHAINLSRLDSSVARLLGYLRRADEISTYLDEVKDMPAFAGFTPFYFVGDDELMFESADGKIWLSMLAGIDHPFADHVDTRAQRLEKLGKVAQFLESSQLVRDLEDGVRIGTGLNYAGSGEMVKLPIADTVDIRVYEEGYDTEDGGYWASHYAPFNIKTGRMGVLYRNYAFVSNGC